MVIFSPDEPGCTKENNMNYESLTIDILLVISQQLSWLSWGIFILTVQVALASYVIRKAIREKK